MDLLFGRLVAVKIADGQVIAQRGGLVGDALRQLFKKRGVGHDLTVPFVDDELDGLSVGCGCGAELRLKPHLPGEL